MKSYDYHHIITFEDTNLVGNVYYANHIRWQGRCREMFLRDNVPEILKELELGLVLVTTRVSCEYIHELRAFDQIIIRMRAGSVSQNKVIMLFDYLKVHSGSEELIAKGEQQIACMIKTESGVIPTPIPQVLLTALADYIIR